MMRNNHVSESLSVDHLSVQKQTKQSTIDKSLCGGYNNLPSKQGEKKCNFEKKKTCPL